MIVEIFLWVFVTWVFSVVGGIIWEINRKVLIVLLSVLLAVIGVLGIWILCFHIDEIVLEWGSIIGGFISGLTYLLPFTIGRDIIRKGLK